MKKTMWRAAVAAGLVAGGTAFAQEPVAAPAPQGAPDAGAKQEKAEKAQTAAEPARESVITAEKIEFDNKEGVILFDENVLVDDAQFVMRSERLLVFMQGTNDVQQIMAVGRVSITNQNRAASCDKAVYTKKDGQIVMSGNARLMRQGDEGGEVTGNRITNSRMAAVLVSPEFWWLEAACSSDVVIRGNVVKGCGQAAIQVLAPGGNGRPLPAGAHRRIAVLDNLLDACPWPVIHATSTEDLTIKGNRWPAEPAPGLSWGRDGKPPVPVLVEQCEQAEVTP